jgi:magnesium-transporting ATPase (P-type)
MLCSANTECNSLCSHCQTTENGLTKPEAARRLTVYGRNSMTPAKARTIWHMIWDQVRRLMLYSPLVRFMFTTITLQVNNLIIYILIISAVITGIFQEWADLILIVIVIIVVS